MGLYYNSHVIFGLHGPLLDTEYLVSKHTADIAAEHGAVQFKGSPRPMTADWVHQHVSGMGSIEKFKRIGQECGVDFVPDELAAMRREHRTRKDSIGQEGDIPLVEGIDRTLEEMGKDRMLSCVSTDPQARSIDNLDKSKLLWHFQMRVYGPREKAKEFPGLDPSSARFADILHQSMMVSGMEAGQTVVVDDSETGMRAGRAVGAGRVIGFLDPRFTGQRAKEKRASLIKAGADHVISDYRELMTLIAGPAPRPSTPEPKPKLDLTLDPPDPYAAPEPENKKKK